MAVSLPCVSHAAHQARLLRDPPLPDEGFARWSAPNVEASSLRTQPPAVRNKFPSWNGRRRTRENFGRNASGIPDPSSQHAVEVIDLPGDVPGFVPQPLRSDIDSHPFPYSNIS